jgi:vitamin B12 transporter
MHGTRNWQAAARGAVSPAFTLGRDLGEDMRRSTIHSKHALRLLAGAAALLPLDAMAQQQSTGTVALPPVVIEGATLAKPVAKVAKPRKPAAEPVEIDEPAPSAPAKKTATKAKAAPAAGEAAPADMASPAGASSDTELRGVASDTVGTAVSVVGGAELEAQQSRHIGEALRSLPGVSVSQQGGAGNLSVVRIRGAESNHTLVVIDGVEVNSGTEGFYDFASLATDDIERIEVLRGPQSGLYGGSALGGVVNIVTRSGKGPLTLRAEGEAGSFDTRGGRVGISGGTDRAWGALSLSSRETAGFNIAPAGTEKDGSSLQALSFKGGISPFENFKLHGAFRMSRLEGDRDGFDGFVGGFNVANDDRSTFERQSWSGRINADLSLLDGYWTHTVYAARSERDYIDHDRGFFPSTSHLIDDNTKYGYQTTLRIDGPAGPAVRHFVTGFIEKQDETFDQPDPLAGDFHAERGRTSVAGEIRGEYLDTVHIAATLRHDDNDAFDDATTWRVQGSARVPSTPLRLHASYGTGIKYPSFAELYGTFFRYTPNPNLQAETSKGWDAGIETTFLGGRAVLDVTYFKADLENEITEDFSGFPLITSVNMAGRSHRQGIEVAGRFALIDGIVVGASYTYLDAEDSAGRVEVRRAPHAGRLDIDWAFLAGRGHLNLAAIYNGEVKDVAFDAFFTQRTVTLDDYWLLRLAASYEVAPGVELFGRVENLLDQRYQEVFGYETAGAAAFAGVRLKLEAPLTHAASLK